MVSAYNMKVHVDILGGVCGNLSLKINPRIWKLLVFHLEFFLISAWPHASSFRKLEQCQFLNVVGFKTSFYTKSGRSKNLEQGLESFQYAESL